MDADKFTDADADAEANEGAGGIQSRDALPGAPVPNEHVSESGSRTKLVPLTVTLVPPACGPI